MDIFGIILFSFLCYRNGSRARLKDQNAFVWGAATGIAVFMCMVVGMAFVLSCFLRGVVNIDALGDPNNKAVYDAAVRQLTQAFATNPLHSITVELFGFGGYLLIRYILERKPDKEKPEVNWMDNPGDQ